MVDIAPLTPIETALINDTETAVRQGSQLMAWWRESHFGDDLKKFPLIPQDPNKTMDGFFGEVLIDGVSRSAMGCIQSLHFKIPDDKIGLAAVLTAFPLRDMYQVSQWKNPDGLPGGFGYGALLCRSRNGSAYGRYRDMAGTSQIDLGLLDTRFDWVMMKVELNDFVRSFPPLRRFAKLLSGIVKEAVYVVAYEDLMQPGFNSSGGAVQASLGYSFVPALVHPNFFGFGPGRFGAAIKLFRFSLLESKELLVEELFLVAPRSQKVLYLWGLDPVYSSAHAVDALCPRRFKIRERFHDYMDFYMLRQHGHVHQNFTLGVVKSLLR